MRNNSIYRISFYPPYLLFEEQMVWVNPLKESKAYYEEYSRYYPLKRSFIFCH